jgi:hypothetical protein
MRTIFASLALVFCAWFASPAQAQDPWTYGQLPGRPLWQVGRPTWQIGRPLSEIGRTPYQIGRPVHEIGHPLYAQPLGGYSYGAGYYGGQRWVWRPVVDDYGNVFYYRDYSFGY